MAIRLKIQPYNSYTEMTIFRSTDPNTLYESTPIFTGTYASEYVDNTGVYETLYYYGVRLSSDGQPDYESPVFQYFYKEDWGPVANIAAANIAKTGKAVYQGTAATGLIIPQFAGVYPTIFIPPPSIATNIVALFAAATGKPANSFNNNVYGEPGNVALLNGKLVSIYVPTDTSRPIINASAFYIAANPTEFCQDVFKIAEYLDNITDGRNTYTIQGYRWRLKVMRESTMMSNANDFVVFGQSSTITQFSRNCNLFGGSPGVIVVAGSSLSSPGGLFNQVNPPTVTIPPSTGFVYSSASILTYFEYVGPE